MSLHLVCLEFVVIAVQEHIVICLLKLLKRRQIGLLLLPIYKDLSKVIDDLIDLQLFSLTFLFLSFDQICLHHGRLLLILSFKLIFFRFSWHRLIGSWFKERGRLLLLICFQLFILIFILLVIEVIYQSPICYLLLREYRCLFSFWNFVNQ